MIIVLASTVVGDADRHFHKLSRNNHQDQVNLLLSVGGIIDKSPVFDPKLCILKGITTVDMI